MSVREDLKKEVEVEEEQVYEMKMDVEESKRRVSSLAELQSELSNMLHISTLAKSRAESQLEKAVEERREMVREIEELRRQRDVLNRRIEFCKQKDAIGMASRLSETCCIFRVYTEEELRLATDNYSERLRLKSGGDWTNVYRGRINHSTVAIKMLNSFPTLSQQDFQSKVNMNKFVFVLYGLSTALAVSTVNCRSTWCHLKFGLQYFSLLEMCKHVLLKNRSVQTCICFYKQSVCVAF